jgi:hypothetical protein
MRRFLAAFCIWWLALGCARVPSDLLRFGMTPEEAASALGGNLVLVKSGRDSEIYAMQRPAAIPGVYPPWVNERIYLQFRKGALTGWKNEWDARKYWF